MEWIALCRVSDKRQAVVNAVLEPRVSSNLWDFLIFKKD